MKINLDSIIEHYINVAMDVTKTTGEPVQIIIENNVYAETYIDIDDDGNNVPFVKYNWTLWSRF